ncbi:MAG: hypothetical protein HQL40_18720 [Alphaproteobacteria bacterium]|nr:hypothetical protein [Alphaproteobacteria bacterium]
MTLTAARSNDAEFRKAFNTARSEIASTVEVNSGISSCADIDAIVQNKPDEKLDWSPLYQYAEQFD